MSKTYLITRICMMALIASGVLSTAFAQARTLDDHATITLTPLSKQDAITPKFGAQLLDYDGIKQSDVDAVVSAFTLTAVIGGDKVEVFVPEFQVDQVRWVADPIGCIDDNPKTKCHPTWGNEYSGQVGGNLPVYVEFATGEVLFFDYGIVNLVLNVTVIDDKVRIIEGYLQINYSIATELPNYRVPIVGKLK